MLRCPVRTAGLVLALYGCTSGTSPRAEVTSADNANRAMPAQVRLEPQQARALLCEVLARYDRDCDTRITRDDWAKCGADCGSAAHQVELPDGRSLSFEHRHQLSQLAQELALQLQVAGEDSQVELDLARVRASPAQTLAWRIENVYWDSLTRTIEPDAATLLVAGQDSKLSVDAEHAVELCPRACSAPSTLQAANRAVRAPEAEAAAAPATQRASTGLVHVYVPAADTRSLSQFGELDLSSSLLVHALPPGAGAEFVSELTRTGSHGLLTLGLDDSGQGRPFVVPGGRFNEMYGWDSYFIALGLLRSPERVELARAMVDNLVYEIQYYGKILNANRTYYLTRSQPPLLTSMVRDVGARLASGARTAQWTTEAMVAAMTEYEDVWTAAPRRSEVCRGEVCLARYFGQGQGEPPEVEPGHFDWFYQHYASATGRCTGREGSAAQQREFAACAHELAEAYRKGELRDERLDAFFTHDRCMRESGHDTTFRWFADGPVPERCADFVTVDLNALLLKYELDIAAWLQRGVSLGISGRDAKRWCDRASARAALMRQHLYDAASGLFYDYDVVRGRRSAYVSATTLYPLWATGPNICGVELLDRHEQERLVRHALGLLEQPGGLSATAAASLASVERPVVLEVNAGRVEAKPVGRQWEYPNGWAPHQMIAWQALLQHGFESDAQRLIYKWLYTIASNAADYHGTVPEKFDVVRRTHQVFEEYGNVNTDFRYIATEGFGWMNASYVVGWELLEPALREALSARAGPEDVYGNSTSAAPEH